VVWEGWHREVSPYPDLRRILPVPVGAGERLFSEPTTAVRRRHRKGAPRPALIDLLPGKPPEDKLDGGEGDEGGQGFREVLQVLAETPVGPSHEKVRSATQRRGRTTKPFWSLRLTICMRSRDTFATAVVNLPGIAPAIDADQVESREALADLAEDQAGPVAVLDRGGVYDDPHRQPLAVDQGVDLGVLYLLAGVVTHLVIVTAPLFRPI